MWETMQVQVLSSAPDTGSRSSALVLRPIFLCPRQCFARVVGRNTRNDGQNLNLLFVHSHASLLTFNNINAKMVLSELYYKKNIINGGLHMDDRYKWHYNDKNFLEFAERNVIEFKNSFDYKNYITPHDEMRELVGKIIEDFQYLEACINSLIKCAIESGLYSGSIKFNFDHYNSATKTIKALKGILIEDRIAKELLSLIEFRNYIIHSHYLNDNRQNIEKEFPNFLFMIYEATDYISNVTNRIKGGATHIPNIFEVKI